MSFLKNYDVKMIGNQVLLKRQTKQEKTAGGLYVPETSKDISNLATVLAVGPGLKDEPMQTEPGDVVLIDAYAGQAQKIEGEEFLIARETEILMVLHKK